MFKIWTFLYCLFERCILICYFTGLGSLYGEQYLPDGRMDRQRELRLVEKCLADYFQMCM